METSPVSRINLARWDPVRTPPEIPHPPTLVITALSPRAAKPDAANVSGGSAARHHPTTFSQNLSLIQGRKGSDGLQRELLRQGASVIKIQFDAASQIHHITAKGRHPGISVQRIHDMMPFISKGKMLRIRRQRFFQPADRFKGRKQRSQRRPSEADP